MMQMLIAHKMEIIGVLLAISEALGLAGKGGMGKMLVDVLKKLAGK